MKISMYITLTVCLIQALMMYIFCAEDIARSPRILMRSFENSFVPRCPVVNILKSTGLIKNGLFISSFIWITEKKFLEKYVTPFEKDLPLVLDAYKLRSQLDHMDILYTLKY
jgi:mTERF domain-containing protein